MEFRLERTRRGILVGVVTLSAGSGCLRRFAPPSDDESNDGSPSTAVFVRNRSDEAHEVTIRITNETRDDVIVTETVSILADDDHRIDVSVEPPTDESPVVGVALEGPVNTANEELIIGPENPDWFTGRIDERGEVSLTISQV